MDVNISSARYDEEMQLIHATMCLAQDAFEEPENGGYCLGTEITFALMYQDVAKICKVQDAIWRELSSGKIVQKKCLDP